MINVKFKNFSMTFETKLNIDLFGVNLDVQASEGWLMHSAKTLRLSEWNVDRIIAVHYPVETIPGHWSAGDSTLTISAAPSKISPLE